MQWREQANVGELRRPRRVATAAGGGMMRRYVDQCLNQGVWINWTLVWGVCYIGKTLHLTFS